MANKLNPLVSIVILNWNGIEDTKICLEYVYKLNYPNYEIIVVDNGSSKEEKNYLSKLKNIVYIDNPVNRGFAGGQADGYRKARGDFILLLNNDAVIDSEYLKNAMPLFSDPSVAVVGGRSYFWNNEETLLDTSNRFYAYMEVNPVTAETTLLMEDKGLIREVNVVSGSAVIVRKSVVDKTGYLWEPFFAYYEETDLFARIKRAGYKVLYNPSLYIWHKNGASSGAQSGSFFFYYHIFRNRYIFAIRNFDDDYFELFKKSYYASLKSAIVNSPKSKAHQTLAKAYVKAASEIRRLEPQLLKDRRDLIKSLNNTNYSRMIISEQISISVVIDGTKLNNKALAELNKKISTAHSPLYEYIIVVDKVDNNLIYSSSSVRYVVDRKYFDTHPVNLGCIAAKNDWIVITDIANLKDISHYSNLIVENYNRSLKAIKLSKSSILITKFLFELIGGLSVDKYSLTKNIQYILKYAEVDGSLLSSAHINITDEERRDIHNQIHSDYELLSFNKSTRWQKLLNRYYRLQQLNNLVVWTVHPKLPLRLKLGRTKNLILSTATLNRTRLATELKHIRNEVFQQSKLQKVSLLRTALKKQASIYTEKQKKDPATIPVFIITFERVNDLKVLVKKLEQLGLKHIIFIDNGSIYPPLLKYLEQSPYQVLELGRNVGHTAPWSLAIVRSLIPLGYYIVTDPDVIPSDECIESSPLSRMLELHEKYPEYQKVGLSLNIDDLPDHYPLKNDVIAWEKQFWVTEKEKGVYEASVDTTFAMYKPTSYSYLLGPSIRIGSPYSSRHMPWYSNPSQQTDEDIFYKNRANSNVTSWNVDELPDRYKKEMKRDK